MVTYESSTNSETGDVRKVHHSAHRCLSQGYTV